MNLYIIYNELQKHKRTRSEVLINSITNRLNKSNMSYEQDMEQVIKYLKSKKQTTIIKRL